MKSTEKGKYQVSGRPCAGRGVLGMLGWRQKKPKWTDDPVQQQGGSRWMGRQGSSGFPPQTDITGGLG